MRKSAVGRLKRGEKVPSFAEGSVEQGGKRIQTLCPWGRKEKPFLGAVPVGGKVWLVWAPEKKKRYC